MLGVIMTSVIFKITSLGNPIIFNLFINNLTSTMLKDALRSRLAICVVARHLEFVQNETATKLGRQHERVCNNLGMVIGRNT